MFSTLVALFAGEHQRLIRMREKFERSTARPLNFHHVRYRSDSSSRRGFAHWYLRPKSGEEVREGLYEDVLRTISRTRNASSLLEYEKMWAQYAIRHVAIDTWKGDPAISGNIPKHLLEQRLELVEKHITVTTYDTADSDGNVQRALIECQKEAQEEAPAALPLVQLHVVRDNNNNNNNNNSTNKNNPYPRQWTFEFGGNVASADAHRAKHRIRRVVGF